MRRFLVGLILLSLLTTVGAKLAPLYIARPDSLSLDEAKREVGGTKSRMVTLTAAPEEGTKWYGAKYYNATDKKVPLSKYSMTAGIPLVGPEAPPASEWNDLVGHEVVVAAGLGSARMMLSSPQKTVEVGGARFRGVIDRRILSPIAGHENLWVLSRSHTTIGGMEGVQPPYNAEESEWAAAGQYRGVLQRFEDFDFSGTSLDSIKDYYRREYGDASKFDDAWLVDSGDYNGGSDEKKGYYFYAPVAGSEGKIWAQFPANDAFETAWKEKRPNEITGIWLPAGAHHFDPVEAGLPAGQVALVRTAGYDREEFVERRWKDRYGQAAFLIGIAATILSSLAVLVYVVATSPLESPPAAPKSE